MFVYVVQVPARVVGSQLGFFDEIDSHLTLQTHALIETEPHAHTNYNLKSVAGSWSLLGAQVTLQA